MRQKDIPLLANYFINRFATKAGNRIRKIDKKTLASLQSYPWPGNIRELQNVIERAVILCGTEIFSIDESHLSPEPAMRSHPISSLSEQFVQNEKEIIEAALAACGGRVSGPSGAARKLGVPSSTLDSKIRTLKIEKYRFKI
jgi:formate hydrogenlyase transcriptional activator